VGGLGHFFEDEGIPTVGISLVREHTEVIRPPRALWVPFELGRPFGVPNDAAFQTRVVRAALRLLESKDGAGLLEDYPEDAPNSPPGDESGWVCPARFALPIAAKASALPAAMADEIRRLAPWYALAVETRGRTTFGASGLSIEQAVRFIAAFTDTVPENPRRDLSLGDAFKLAFEDIGAWYTEAATARPGTVSAKEVADWFWDETSAGAILRQVQAKLADSEDKQLQLLAKSFLVPRTQERHAD
jgi:hypothetical protein